MVAVTPHAYDKLARVQAILHEEQGVKLSLRQVIEYLISHWDRTTS